MTALVLIIGLVLVGVSAIFFDLPAKAGGLRDFVITTFVGLLGFAMIILSMLKWLSVI